MIISMVKRNPLTTTKWTKLSRRNNNIQVYHKDKTSSSGKTSFGRWRQDQSTRVMAWKTSWSRTCHSPFKHSSGSVMAWACMVVSGTGTLVFIDNVTEFWGVDCLIFTCWKETSDRKAHKRRATGTAVKAWQSTKEDTQHLLMSMNQKLQGFSTKY